MACPAVDHDIGPSQTLNARDHTNLRTGRLKHWSLFDMRLECPTDREWNASIIAAITNLLQRLQQGDPIPVGLTMSVVLRYLARPDARS